MGFLQKLFGNYSAKELKRIQPLCDQVLSLEETYAPMRDEELAAQTGLLKERLNKGETLDDILPDAFAVCREASWRVLEMKHFPVQILGGIVLHQGRISEMKTGEGKTLVATLPTYLNALEGKGVHIVTVNDYLARRDSEWMGKVYSFLGLSVGLIVHGKDPLERREAYGSDITYGTNNEFGFDYLRDNMVTYKENCVQRGHHYAIVDEVDSILVDEARTPLIISGKGDKSTELYTLANRFAKTLRMVKSKELNEKEDNDELYSDADYLVDEKAKSATLTPNGVAKAEKSFNVENLMDMENITLLHHINQAIKANSIMHRDIDYVVKEGEVIIVDEFTGRLMYGRRYNEGLHQAIEAKEGVKVEHESKTLATITFQNYFRMYKKLAGMTGTAMTEEAEFREIYKLDVVEIPTNKPLVREDRPDTIYKTERAKFHAVIDKIVESNKTGQPVLVGTISIEKSEVLSELLKRRGIKHEVLNAKYHEKEAEIISQAGKFGQVTIATNMAGRGTDIMLGGNAEHMAKSEMRRMQFSEELISEATGFAETDDEEILGARKTFKELNAKYKAEIAPEAKAVCDAGGLFIIGTERHESRRIDNQLRGRSGRQGDPGASQFFLSLEDDLMRLFGGERINAIMDTLSIDEDTPIEAKLISNQIENAQKKVESRNFAIRKNVLQYDDVMNRQREIMYGQRGKVLNGEDLSETVQKMMTDNLQETCDRFLTGELVDEWNIESLRDYYLGWALEKNDLRYTDSEKEHLIKEDIVNELTEKVQAKYKHQADTFGEETIRELERMVLLRSVDTFWMEHIDSMEELKQGIALRSYAQHDPVVAYRTEGFDMFDEMIASIRENTIRLLLTAHLKSDEEIVREQIAKPSETSSDGTDPGSRTVRNSGKKVGRNDLCPCGSGKKYKKCCALKEEGAE